MAKLTLHLENKNPKRFIRRVRCRKRPNLSLAIPSTGTPRLQAVVTGIRPADTVEFIFVYGDPDLAVELVLPASAFREFCSENGCFVAVPDDMLRSAVRRLINPLPVVPFIPHAETEPHP